MSRPSHTPIWPLLLVGSFLFLLSLIAIQRWPLTPAALTARQLAARGDHTDPRDPRRWPGVADDPVIDASTSLPAGECETDGPSPTNPLDSAPMDSEPLLGESTSDVAPRDASPIDPMIADADENDPFGHDHDNASRNHDAIEPPDAGAVTSDPRAVQREPAKPTVLQRVRRDRGWPEPVELVRRLDGLTCECDCSLWAIDATELLVELTEQTAPDDARAAEILVELRSHAAKVDALLPHVNERNVSIELLRVRHALSRRLDVWELMPELVARRSELNTLPDSADVAQLTKTLDSVESVLRLGGAEGEHWRKYLAIDELRKLSIGDTPADGAARANAREILARLDRRDLSSWQRQFVTEGPVAELRKALRPWIREPLDPTRLLADIEHFETTSHTSDAHRLSDDWPLDPNLTDLTADLCQRLEANYRNANARFVLSEKLLKRLLPAPETSVDPVRDQILGVPTRGVSTTSTQVNVQLVPNERRLRLALEASGQIFANTRSSASGATLFSQSDSLYHARKVLEIDLHGIRTYPAESDCLEAHTQLRSVSTGFDGVPLLGAMVESFARSKHAEQEPEVRSVLRRKVETQARAKMDQVADQRIEKVNALLKQRLLIPLDRLELDPQVISAETSDQRLSMRLRLASADQLAGCTPRPRAPGDSLASLQIHQSLFNNACEQLELDGRTYRLADLRKHIVEMLNLQSSPFMTEVDKDVSITFADRDALSVRCERGRIELNLAVARLVAGDRNWKNFIVRVYYQPQVDGLSARLVRDGSVQLIGRLGTRSQVALRGVFSKAFSKERDLVLVDSKWSTDERTRGLYFSQFVIQDGWIAVAVAEPADNVAHRPKGAPDKTPATAR